MTTVNKNSKYSLRYKKENQDKWIDIPYYYSIVEASLDCGLHCITSTFAYNKSVTLHTPIGHSCINLLEVNILPISNVPHTLIFDGNKIKNIIFTDFEGFNTLYIQKNLLKRLDVPQSINFLKSDNVKLEKCSTKENFLIGVVC